MSSGCAPTTVEDVTAQREAVIRLGRKQLDIITQFEHVFPKAVHAVAYVTGKERVPVWRSQAGVFSRYLITVEFPIEYNRDLTEVRRIGEWNMQLNEVRTIGRLPDGRRTTMFGEQINIDAAKWEAIRRSGRVETVLPISTDAPVPGFGDALLQK